MELVLDEYTLQLTDGHQETRPSLHEEFQKESRLLIEPFGEPVTVHPSPLTSGKSSGFCLTLSSPGQPVHAGGWPG